jgi:hypothetical protein
MPENHPQLLGFNFAAVSKCGAGQFVTQSGKQLSHRQGANSWSQSYSKPCSQEPCGAT